MRISRVRAHCCRLPLKSLEKGGIAPYQLSYRLATHADRVFIELETDEGLTGWEAEMTLPAEVIRAFYENAMQDAVTGLDPRKVNCVNQVFRSSTIKKYLNEQVFLAPIEIACWDILGQSVGLSISDLIGGRLRDRLPCAFCIGVLPEDLLVASVGCAVTRGFRTVKIKGDSSFQADVGRLHAVSAAYPGVTLRIDPNQAWTIGDCLRFTEAVAGLNIEYLEQPIRVKSLQELSLLRQKSRIPIAVNDDCYEPWALASIATAQAADVAIVDLEPLGGIWGLIRAAHFAETVNLALTHHTGFDFGVKTAAVAHVASAFPAFRTALDSTYSAHDDDVLEEHLHMENGNLFVPDAPGLGIRVCREKLAEYRL